MKYEIKDDNFPVVICHLNKGEKMISINDAIISMDSCIKTKPSRFTQFLKHIFPAKTLFKNISAASNEGKITFADGFPGNILPLNVESGKKIVILKSSFLASEESVFTSAFQAKKIYTDTFDDDSLTKISGQGMCFLKVIGHITEYNLLPGQQMIINNSNLVMMDATCKIKMLSATNRLINNTSTKTIVTGPGRLIVQNMPFSNGLALSSLDRRNI